MYRDNSSNTISNTTYYCEGRLTYCVSKACRELCPDVQLSGTYERDPHRLLRLANKGFLEAIGSDPGLKPAKQIRLRTVHI